VPLTSPRSGKCDGFPHPHARIATLAAKPTIRPGMLQTDDGIVGIFLTLM
jgi:hypothetical protein